MCMKPFCSAKWWTFITQWSTDSTWQNSIFTIFQPGKLFSDFFCFRLSVYNCFSICFQTFSILKATIDEKPWCLKFGSVSEQGTETTIHKETAILFPPNVSQMLSYWSTDCAAESFKPRVILHDQRGNQPSKNRENMDFSSDSARILAFSTHWHEANKSNRQREERPIGSRTVKMLRDLQRRVRSLAADSRTACGGGERARCM